MANGELDLYEPHPIAYEAKAWVGKYLRSDPMNTMLLQESLASTALSGNRSAEIMSETLRRLLNGESVSDRYLLGLAWFLRNWKNENDATPENSQS